MVMLVKDKLDKLTNGDVKKIVTAAVAAEKAKPSKAGVKLIEEYNKLYVEILKFKKVYEAKMPEVEAAVKATNGKDIDDPAFEKAQDGITSLRKDWAAVVGSFKKFETVETDLKKAYALR